MDLIQSAANCPRKDAVAGASPSDKRGRVGESEDSTALTTKPGTSPVALSSARSQKSDKVCAFFVYTFDSQIVFTLSLHIHLSRW